MTALIQGTAPLLFPQDSVWRRQEIFCGERHTVVSVIGDGSLTGGMAYEALNNAAHLDTNFIVDLK